MFKVIKGSVYSFDEMCDFLMKLGFSNPTEATTAIKKNGFAAIGELRIAYVPR